MKENKLNRIIDIALKLSFITIIVIMITFRITDSYCQYEYYIVRWAIFILFIYFAFRIRRKGILIILLSCAISILFNPFIFLGFRIETGFSIDMIFSIIIVIALIYNLTHYLESLQTEYWIDKSTNEKLVHNLILYCYLGLVFLIVGFGFTLDCIHQINNENLLLKKGINTKGYITEVHQKSSDSDTQGTKNYNCYSYSFTTYDGKQINSSSCNNGMPDKVIDIVYLLENPEINMPKDNVHDNLIEFIRQEIYGPIIIALIFLLLGTVFIIKNTKIYIKEKKQNDLETK